MQDVEYINDTPEIDLGTLVDAAVEQLPPQQKKVYLLSRLERLKQEEIAHELGISLETVKNTWYWPCAPLKLLADAPRSPPPYHRFPEAIKNSCSHYLFSSSHCLTYGTAVEIFPFYYKNSHMSDSRLAYLFKAYFNKTASFDEWNELMTLLEKEEYDEQVKTLLTEAWEQTDFRNEVFDSKEREKMLAKIISLQKLEESVPVMPLQQKSFSWKKLQLPRRFL
ncbi:sigma factor-like helix-turn-helix DNA-binding protein [Paraflavitalea speifideaquila]|uniref:sigma factor-like helix-turn-helix DNA-binding protein n=1 Tax=Paraflavitalea speifideaquila TaxID=3076558 RepID=UPI0028F1747F|nr:sigma factor-like helix-turn-helix DNA-binding protein [Paraflavitalea speifideiaquila]